MEVKVEVNTVNVVKELKRMSAKQKASVTKALNKVSNMAIFMIDKRTKKGLLPDGGKMIPYAKSTVKRRKKKGRQTGFVDLEDSGQMFRSLTYDIKGLKSSLFFRGQDQNKKASYHDFFGVGKKKTIRPFFSIGNKEEDKIRQEFTKTYFKAMKI
jgi:hypothetical protein|tara:strand:- start:35 stop:499 length:465 start_codon:yes stop_codon:yes gene_type:complete